MENVKQRKPDEEIREKGVILPSERAYWVNQSHTPTPNLHHEPITSFPHNIKHRAEGLSKI